MASERRGLGLRRFCSGQVLELGGFLFEGHGARHGLHTSYANLNGSVRVYWRKGAILANFFGGFFGGRKPPFPPGELFDLEKLERQNRRALIELSAKHGPIFKIKEEGQPQICVVGMDQGRALLKDHASSLQPVNIDITPIVKAGFMRHMSGDVHKKYRSTLIAAVASLSIESALEDCAEIARGALSRFADAKIEGDDAPVALHDALSEVATGFLIRIFFGLRPGTANFQKVASLFQVLGPHGVVWNVGDGQKRAFDAIADALRDLLTSGEAAAVSNVVSSIDQNGQLDATMLGNLIYMVEIGRYDLAGLFKWTCRNAAATPDFTNLLRKEADRKSARDLARAFALETLRMDQSERLIRKVTTGFIFQGLQFPKDWRVRICMWETHKLEKNFEAPLEFRPQRFLKNPPSPNVYSPFGLDQHQCPLSAVSVALAAQFVLTLIECHDISAVNDGRSVRGPYHWEPPVDFYVRLHSVSGQVNA